MASPVEAQLLLCDAAVADPSGKLHMLGVGWTNVGVPMGPHAVAILFKIPWDRANQKIKFKLTLRNSDGQPLQFPGPDGSVQTLSNEGEVEVGRPPGITHGSPLTAAMSVSVPPLPLGPGRYEWLLEVAQTEVFAAFEVVAPR